MKESYNEIVFGIESYGTGGTGGTDDMSMARGHGWHGYDTRARMAGWHGWHGIARAAQEYGWH